MPRRTTLGATTLGAMVSCLAIALVLSGCSAPLEKPSASDRTTPPKLGACYLLDPKDTDKPSSDVTAVSCSTKHTSQTFAVGTLPDALGKDYSGDALGRWIYPRCERSFERFIGVDQSLALRVQLSWAWFRASEKGWGKGARWYRCDLVGGRSDASSYAALPTTAKGLFRAKPPEQWLTCARGKTVLKGAKVPCSEQHDWRAVTTIKVGEPEDPYPGDRIVQVRSRDFCSDSVGAWMNYPIEYQYGFTWFHEAEWKTGNRRSVCWAGTDR